MTTGRINQIAIHFPSLLPFSSRRRSERVLDRRRKSPGTTSPQAVQTCTARERFGGCFISICGSRLAGCTPSFEEATQTCDTFACSFNECCSPLEVLASRRHAWIVHPSLFLTARTTRHRVARLRTNPHCFHSTFATAGPCDS